MKNCSNNVTKVTNPFPYYTSCSKPYLIPITLRYCKFDAKGNGYAPCGNDISSLLSPSLNNGVCTNLVKSVSYILQYYNPSGFTHAFADVEFFDLAVSSVARAQIKQSFQVYYVPSSLDLVNKLSFFLINFNGNSFDSQSRKL